MGCEAAQHDLDHGEADEGGGDPGVTLEVAREAAVAADPGEGALDDPALGQGLEARDVGPRDDLDPPRAAAREAPREAGPAIAAVGEDALDEGEEASGAPVEHARRAVAILDVGGVDDDVQQQAKRVDEDVTLASRRLLARVVARRIDRGPPFEAPRAVWLSMIAAVGLASRPARSREAT